MRALAVLLLLGLAACGVDGRPVAPNANKVATEPVQISGAVEVGIAETR